MSIYDFMGAHPFVTFFLAAFTASVLKSPFWALNRYFRTRNIAAKGWPPPHLDADGDWKDTE